MPPFVQANTNGRLHDAAEVSLSPLNRGFLYGDAIYEVWRTYDRRLFGWEEHWERLQVSASALAISIPFSAKALLEQIRRTVSAFDRSSPGRPDVYVRLQIYRGEGRIGLDPRLAGADAAGFVILVQPVPSIPPPQWDQGLNLTIARHLRRNPPQALNPAWKTGNYLNNLLCLHEAKSRGADDALMLNLEGDLTEATTSNVAFIVGHQFVTPPLSAGMLAGVTRRLILERVARAAGLDPVEKTVRVDDLSRMDECMLLSTTKDVQPVGRIDDVAYRVGEGTVSRTLKAAFASYVSAHLESRQDLSV